MNSKPWHINILTLFPEMFPGPLGQSLPGKALDNNLWSYGTINPRDFAQDKHKTVDDTPFGGGAGMVMKPDILEKAVRSIETPGKKIYLSPRGRRLDQSIVKELVEAPALTLLCGRYEGVDQRVLDACDFEEISIGDYVLAGGELPAMVLIEACIRFIPGVLGNSDTVEEESFSGGLLEYPHYTRPAEWIDAAGQARKVPEVLTSGHHGKVETWRKEQSEELTRTRRPDLWKAYQNNNAE